MRTTSRTLAVVTVLLMAVAGPMAGTGALTHAANVPRAAIAGGAPHFVAAWGYSMSAPITDPDAALQSGSNYSCRFVVRPTISGASVRIRLSNAYSTGITKRALTFGTAYIGVRGARAAVVAGSNRPLTFHGLPGVTIPPGQQAVSDALPFPVRAMQDLAVSLYMPAHAPSTAQANALVTSYCTGMEGGAGNHTTESAGIAFNQAIRGIWWLDGLDVLAPATTSAIVCLGDYLTFGYNATLDGHDGWTDVLARRMQTLPAGQRKAVINVGSFDQLLGGFGSMKGRLTSDVLQRAGVTHVIVFAGSIDMSPLGGAGTSPAAVPDIIGALRRIAATLKSHGLIVIGATLTPLNLAPSADLLRDQVNTWIRTSHTFAAVIDFDKVLRDPAKPQMLQPRYDSGNSGTPSPLGYAAMGAAIDPALFKTDSSS